MREILFRGKRIDNGEWIEGSLVVAGDYCCILTADENSVHLTDYPYLDPETGTIDGHLIPVDPSTVGQCVSGVTDCYGKKIFDGDIVSYAIYIGMGCGYGYGQVVYRTPSFIVDCGKQRVRLFSSCDSENDYVVCGNIYDNPELLEDNP